MKLEAATTDPPPGLQELLADLGDGENGFGGTPVHAEELTLEEYLRECCDMPDPAKLRPGLVPQTVFWALDDDGEAVGIVRLRHYLNNTLRVHGGHIGYYVRRDQRGHGYGKEMLRLALDELRRLGETRALITTDPENVHSIRVIEANGGQFADVSSDPRTGAQYRRYWVDLEPQQDPAAGADKRRR
jgi:predicted acetyltransferase